MAESDSVDTLPYADTIPEKGKQMLHVCLSRFNEPSDG